MQRGGVSKESAELFKDLRLRDRTRGGIRRPRGQEKSAEGGIIKALIPFLRRYLIPTVIPVCKVTFNFVSLLYFFKRVKACFYAKVCQFCVKGKHVSFSAQR